MNVKTEITAGGLSVQWILTIAFIILKLCNVINWSWWWVFSPIWISLGLALALVLIVGLVILINVLTQHDFYDEYDT